MILRSQSRPSLALVYILPFLIASMLSHAARRDLPLSSRPALRFAGTLASAADLIWVQVAGRIPFLDRVTPREAELNYRLLRVATRLDPDNPEPWRYGSLGLMLWGRTDLALQFGRDGLAHRPDDSQLEQIVYAAAVYGSPTDTAAYRRVLNELISDPTISPTARRYLIMLTTLRMADQGRFKEAVASCVMGIRIAREDPVDPEMVRNFEALYKRLQLLQTQR